MIVISIAVAAVVVLLWASSWSPIPILVVHIISSIRFPFPFPLPLSIRILPVTSSRIIIVWIPGISITIPGIVFLSLFVPYAIHAVVSSRRSKIIRTFML
jgi:hypothetical protein